MDLLQAILLGIIQGLTEFLPISSTAHLTIAGRFMGLIDNPEKWTAFMAVVQLGTLAAVLIYFAKDIASIAKAFLTENLAQRRSLAQQSTNARLGWFVIVGSIPIVVLGLAFKDLIEGEATKQLPLIASSLIGLAVLLWIAERVATFKKSIADITWRDAIIIGFAQSIALIPGSSRSGTTITAGLFTGLQRDAAARFSFLLSIPAVFGSGILEFYHSVGLLSSDELTTLAAATLAAGISGYAAIAFLLRFLRTHSTVVFIIYRILLGLALFGLVYS